MNQIVGCLYARQGRVQRQSVEDIANIVVRATEGRTAFRAVSRDAGEPSGSGFRWRLPAAVAASLVALVSGVQAVRHLANGESAEPASPAPAKRNV